MRKRLNKASETTIAYLDVLEYYVSRYGRPLSLYSDRHSIFTKHKDEDIDPMQFRRACLQLDIESVLALSPQANAPKGRGKADIVKHRMAL